MKNGQGDLTEKRWFESDWFQFCRDNALSLFFIPLSYLGAFALCYLQAFPERTPRENFLESGGLLLLSSWGSFLIAKILADLGYNKTLRDHGVQIASNIVVLKRQIEHLAEWVAQKRGVHKKDVLVDANLEHIEQTLITFSEMNNATLGAVTGVIGDALAQYNAIMKQVSDIRGSANEETSKLHSQMQVANSKDIPALQTQIEQIERDSENRVAALSYRTPLPIPSAPIKKTFSDECPYCHEINKFEMIDRLGETLPITCKHCQGRFNAHISRGQVITRPAWASEGKALVSSRQEIPSAPPRQEVESVKLKDSLLQRSDWMSNDKELECKKLLSEMKYYIGADLLLVLCKAAALHDQQLRDGPHATPSPYDLLSSLLRSPPVAISNTTIRSFFKIIMAGSAFQFTQMPHWKFPYQNSLSEKALITAFIRGSVKRIIKLRPLTKEDADWVARLLAASDGAMWVEMIREIIHKGG